MNLSKFKTFLIKSGVDMLETTNPYEKVRFRCKEGVGIVYKGKRGLTFTGASVTAREFFENKKEWRASKKYKRFEKPHIRNALIKRDGENCFYCGTKENLTIEHLLSIASGGNDHLDNLCLACKQCNYQADTLPIVMKFKLIKGA